MRVNKQISIIWKPSQKIGIIPNKSYQNESEFFDTHVEVFKHFENIFGYIFLDLA